MKIIHPFKVIDKKLFVDNLVDNLTPNYSLKYKLYYVYLRPVLPMKVRQMMQVVYNFNARLNYRSDFIYDGLVNFAREHNDYDSVVKTFYPNGYETSIILTHDVDHQIGFNNIPRILELEEKYGFKSCWNIVPYKYKIDKGIIKLIQDAGHEIGVHGYNHDGRLYSSWKVFNERVPFINQAIKNFKSSGFRSPMVHHNLEWLQQLDIRYDCSCFDYDPFQPFPNSTGMIWPFIAGKFVELPYTLPQDHTLIYVLKQNNIDIWKNKIDWLVKNKGMILTLTHPDYLISKKRFNMYRQLLDYLKTVQNAWHCLPREMAEWWFLREQKEKMINLYLIAGANGNGNGNSSHEYYEGHDLIKKSRIANKTQ
ncbi:MAG: polysaccharide deacetylase family protein [Ignavibacteriaceae bacterium]